MGKLKKMNDPPFSKCSKPDDPSPLCSTILDTLWPELGNIVSGTFYLVMFPVWLKHKGKHRAGIGESKDIYQCLEKRVALEKHIKLIRVTLCVSFKTSSLANPFVWKWFTCKWICKRNTVLLKFFRTKTCFDTETKANSEMASLIGYLEWDYKEFNDDFRCCYKHSHMQLCTFLSNLNPQDSVPINLKSTPWNGIYKGVPPKRHSFWGFSIRGVS